MIGPEPAIPDDEPCPFHAAETRPCCANCGGELDEDEPCPALNSTPPTTGELLGALARIDEIASDTLTGNEGMTVEEYAEACRRIETHEALRDALRDVLAAIRTGYANATILREYGPRIERTLALLEP